MRGPVARANAWRKLQACSIPGAVRGSCDERTGSMKLKEVGARQGLTKDGGVLRTGQSLDFCGNRGRDWKQVLQHRKLEYG